VAGRPLVWYALEALRACSEIAEIVLVVAAEDVELARQSLIRAGTGQCERVVAGGADRIASVRAGLAEVSAASDVVLVHDGARPFLTPELVRRCLEGAAIHQAVVAALPAAETIKDVSPDGLVRGTLERSRLWAVQTPQVFRRSLLEKAHEAAARAGVSGTDDASLVERLGHPVHVVMGDPENIKVTWPQDLAQAERVVREREHPGEREPATRVGIGYDAHRFAAAGAAPERGAERPAAEGRALMLGGVRFEAARGLVGHSDADVVCHAICDALLGALGAGDIGTHFPDSDPQFAGISSLALLERVAGMVRAAGCEIANADAVVIAEEPRIAPRVPEMRRALAGAMGIEESRVNVKGKTEEGMGFTGRREGIASQAVCLLRTRL
jgi:2-C-methyl-D-erythritol 4-phosphate cytidylyltransferase/2-C-methyl-D-erythritol 2,4-cyclodiphosphate synthase